MPERGRERLLQVALTAALLVVSMLLALAGQALIAYFFGAGPRSDALFLARDVADLGVKAMLAAQATGVLVPMVLAVKGRGGTPVADRVLAGILTLVALAGLALAAVLEAAAGPIVAVLAPGFDDASQDLAVTLTRIVAPMAPLVVISTLTMAALQAKGRFGRAQLLGVANGVALVATMPVLIHLWGVEGAAAAMLAGAAVQAVVGWGFLVAEGMPVVVAPWRVRAEAREFARRLVPFLGYAAATQGGGVVLRVTLSTLAAGSYAAYALGTRLHRSVVTLVLTPIQQVLLPALAHSEAADRREEADAELVVTLRSTAFVALPVAVALCALSRETVSVVLERGAFDAADADRTAAVLAVLAVAIVPTGLYLLLEQAAYARRRAGLVVKVNVALEAVQAALFFPLALWLGVEGIAVASGIALVVAAAAYLRTLRPGATGSGDHRGFALRLLGCAAAMLVAVLLTAAAVRALADPAPGLEQVLVLVPASVAGTAAYLAAAHGLAVTEGRRIGALAAAAVRRRA